ncbi:MAG TPA: hypothetical protein VFO60_03245, partial [Candidatus Dormibacteraeota bacterium]|nr:hypothetical protein [Candidatus Dormibacteraeota bacterium]
MRVGLGVSIVALALFFGAVVPLLTSRSATPVAEVNGKIPAQLTLGSEGTVTLAVDNTSDAIISTICLRVTVDPPATVTPVSASFQGLETIPLRDGRFCGGSLSGQEVISVRMLIAGAQTGGARLTIVAN